MGMEIVCWHMGVSENNGTPKSSILIGFSFINHPFWGTPIFGNTQFEWRVSFRIEAITVEMPAVQTLLFVCLVLILFFDSDFSNIRSVEVHSVHVGNSICLEVWFPWQSWGAREGRSETARLLEKYQNPLKSLDDSFLRHIWYVYSMCFCPNWSLFVNNFWADRVIERDMASKRPTKNCKNCHVGGMKRWKKVGFVGLAWHVSKVYQS